MLSHWDSYCKSSQILILMCLYSFACFNCFFILNYGNTPPPIRHETYVNFCVTWANLFRVEREETLKFQSNGFYFSLQVFITFSYLTFFNSLPHVC